MNKTELANFLDAKERIKQMIISYETGKLALTKDQVSEMWSVYHTLNRKCSHPQTMERHYVSDHEDEYSQIHYSPNCKIICIICNGTIKEGQQHMSGMICAVTGENHYFDYYHRHLVPFDILLDENGKRTETKMVFNKIKPLLGFWEFAGPPPEPIPPSPPKKPEYLEQLENLEATIKESN